MANEAKTMSVRNLRLPTQEAIAKIQADDKLSEANKAYLVGKVTESGFAGVIVDAHESKNGGETHIHISITKLY